jgi:hypothetical protein
VALQTDSQLEQLGMTDPILRATLLAATLAFRQKQAASVETLIVAMLKVAVEWMKEKHSDLTVKLNAGKINSDQWKTELAGAINTNINTEFVCFQAYIYHDGPISIKAGVHENRRAGAILGAEQNMHGKYVATLMAQHAYMKQVVFETVCTAEIGRSKVLLQKAGRAFIVVMKVAKLAMGQLDG